MRTSPTRGREGVGRDTVGHGCEFHRPHSYSILALHASLPPQTRMLCSVIFTTLYY
ncbi:hypothetical protein BD311DRAFT_757574 [Dichomitus squalens]|uniref:Uncharacterized protein n=1 Tax=Dichomitus squalens TaxID=114155 RepID=A0A4Q9MMA2_9APHY|nr:hypothetical protein BD311DRAFT_757574 [Dichomitus squalens]